jgi:hypothetical protein
VAIERETTRLPVRSALFKQRTGGLVVRWVTTSEYPLLYVFAILFYYYFNEAELGRMGIVAKKPVMLNGSASQSRGMTGMKNSKKSGT